MRMRLKNFTLVFLMGLFGLFTTSLFAQQDATIAPENVRFWIGEGESQAVFIVNWADPDTALAWGYRFEGESVILKTMMDDIAEADYRFGYSSSGSSIADVTFNDGVLDLSLTQQFWVMYLVDGEPVWDYFDVQTIANGQYVKMGDTYCGTMVDPENWIYVWEKPVAPVYPLADEAMIDPSEILYWIGEGENEVVFAVNFAEPEDVCYAWGYRFTAESVTVKEMMEAIAEADLRFAFSDEPSPWGGYMLTGLTFDYHEMHYDLIWYNAVYNVNGSQALLTYDAQTVMDGDFVKWGEYTIGTEIAPWTYVWTTPVTPVMPLDATIAFDEVLYWVGEGENQVVFIGNWADPETALAWGYRFSEETITVKDVLDGITAVDPRLSYTASGSWFTDLMYNDGILDLRLAGGWWMFNVNGQTAGNYFDAQPVVNGDVIKFGDESCGIITDPELWTYVWLTHIEPVHVYDAVSENATSLSLYPNPATSYTMLEVSDVSDAVVTVSDLQGRVLNSFTVAQTNEPVRIETAGYQAGIYFVTVSNATSRQTLKLTVK